MPYKYKLLITGSRHFEDLFHAYGRLQLLLNTHSGVIESPSEILVVHGGAKGADSMFDTAGDLLGLTVESYPAEWDTYGKRAGTLRNKQMLEMYEYDQVYGCPLPGSIGTWHMLRIASKAGLTCRMRHPKSGKETNFHWSMEHAYRDNG